MPRIKKRGFFPRCSSKNTAVERRGIPRQISENWKDNEKSEYDIAQTDSSEKKRVYLFVKAKQEEGKKIPVITQCWRIMATLKRKGQDDECQTGRVHKKKKKNHHRKMQET